MRGKDERGVVELKKKTLMNPIHQGGAVVNLESEGATRPRLHVSPQHGVKRQQRRRRLLPPMHLQRVREKWVKRVVLALRGGGDAPLELQPL